MLQNHGGALEADLHRFYGMDLADLWRGTLGARKISVLLEHLPEESAVRRAEGGAGSLTMVERFLRELRHIGELQLYQGGGGKGQKPKPPKDPPTYQARLKDAQKLAARQHRYLDRYRAQLPADVAAKLGRA